MGIVDPFDHGLAVEIQAGEITRVGVVFVAEIDRVRTVVDGRLQCRKAAGGTDEFGNFALRHGKSCENETTSIPAAPANRMISINFPDYPGKFLGLRGALVKSRSYSQLGSSRKPLATMPICQGITV